MSSASQSTPTVPVAPSYARVIPSGNRRGWLIAAILVGLAVLVLGLASRSSALMGRLLGRTTSTAASYTVRPLDMNITLMEDGELKPRESVEIKCDVEGGGEILFVVAESTAVKSGDLLVELASKQLIETLENEQITLNQVRTAAEAAIQEQDITLNENASNIRKAQINLEVAELELRQYLEGDFPKQLKDTEINITQSKMEIEQKQDELNKKQKLAEKKYVTRTELEKLEFDLEKARMTLTRNELARKILEEYDSPKTRKQKQSAVDQAKHELEREQKRAESRAKQAAAKVEEQSATLRMRENRLKRIEEQVRKCKVYAPVDGIAQYPINDNMFRGNSGGRIAVGEKVYEGQVLVVLPNTSQMLVSTRIHEADRHRVREGMDCLVKVPAVPGAAFTGKLSKITTFADSANRWLNPELKEHTTEIVLDSTDAHISPGDSAEIEIQIERANGVLAVPVQCVVSRGPKRYVFIDRGGAASPAEVKLGRSNVNLIEVTEGLKSGDVVRMHLDEALLATLPESGSTAATEPVAPRPPANA
jgi:multidrug resistance efflux pump